MGYDYLYLHEMIVFGTHLIYLSYPMLLIVFLLNMMASQ